MCIWQSYSCGERQNLNFTGNEIREIYFQIESKQMGLIFLCSSKLKLLFLSCSKIKLTSESANFQINSRTCWYLSGPGNVIPGVLWAFLLLCSTQGVIHCFKSFFIPPQRPPLIFVTAGFCFPFEDHLA